MCAAATVIIFQNTSKAARNRHAGDGESVMRRVVETTRVILHHVTHSNNHLIIKRDACGDETQAKGEEPLPPGAPGHPQVSVRSEKPVFLPFISPSSRKANVPFMTCAHLNGRINLQVLQLRLAAVKCPINRSRM